VGEEGCARRALPPRVPSPPRVAAADYAPPSTRRRRRRRRHPPARLPPVQNGHIKRITDADIQSSVLEVSGTNVSTTYIACPPDGAAGAGGERGAGLGVKLPFLVMIIKNLKKYLTFEVTILDDKNVRRRFRASNFQVSQQAHGERERARRRNRSAHVHGCCRAPAAGPLHTYAAARAAAPRRRRRRA
jgi:hypothetical protein